MTNNERLLLMCYESGMYQSADAIHFMMEAFDDDIPDGICAILEESESDDEAYDAMVSKYKTTIKDYNDAMKYLKDQDDEISDIEKYRKEVGLQQKVISILDGAIAIIGYSVGLGGLALGMAGAATIGPALASVAGFTAFIGSMWHLGKKTNEYNAQEIEMLRDVRKRLGKLKANVKDKKQLEKIERCDEKIVMKLREMNALSEPYVQQTRIVKGNGYAEESVNNLLGAFREKFE